MCYSFRNQQSRKIEVSIYENNARAAPLRAARKTNQSHFEIIESESMLLSYRLHENKGHQRGNGECTDDATSLHDTQRCATSTNIRVIAVWQRRAIEYNHTRDITMKCKLFYSN